MSAFLDESLYATTIGVASKLSLALEIGLEAYTCFNIGGSSLFGSSKASLQPGIVSALPAETNEAALLRLELSTQVVFLKAYGNQVQLQGPPHHEVPPRTLDPLSRVHYPGWTSQFERPPDQYLHPYYGCRY